MNLLVISSRYPFPLEKGDKLRLYHQIKHLAQYHEITLISVSDESITDHDQLELSSYLEAQYHFDISKGVRFYNRMISILSSIPLQVGQLYDRSIMKAILKIADRHHTEHVYCQLPRAAEYARRLPFPKTIDFMDAFGESMSRRADIHSGLTKWLYTLEAKRMKVYESKIFSAFDRHTLISEQDKGYMSIAYLDQIDVVPNGIDTDYFYFKKDATKKSTLAFVGNMGYPPNEAAAMYIVENILPLCHEKYTLRISGARPTAKVKQLASNQIQIVGWLDDIREAYHLSKIFIAPIFSGTGQQNKILESMASGIPCITTTVVNNAIGAKANAEILIADTPEEFCQAINSLLRDEALYHNIQHNARNFVVQKYSWEEQVMKLNHIINNIKNKS